jgi:hypothetical protein
MLGVNYVGIHFKALKHGINTSMRSVMIKLIKTFSTNRKLDTYFITKLGFILVKYSMWTTEGGNRAGSSIL